jgi:hypothetical protein
MSEFRYPEIERELVAELPELLPAAEHYWRTWGEPGQDPGPYVFFDEVFSTYVEVLLWLPEIARRDELLRRAFAVVERMLLSADPKVKELAFVGLYEGRDPAWLRLARDFVGAQGRAYLRRWNDNWVPSQRLDVRQLIQGEILDACRVRSLIARELQIPVDTVPGRSDESA